MSDRKCKKCGSEQVHFEYPDGSFVCGDCFDKKPAPKVYRATKNVQDPLLNLRKLTQGAVQYLDHLEFLAFKELLDVATDLRGRVDELEQRAFFWAARPQNIRGEIGTQVLAGTGPKGALRFDVYEWHDVVTFNFGKEHGATLTEETARKLRDFLTTWLDARPPEAGQ